MKSIVRAALSAWLLGTTAGALASTAAFAADKPSHDVAIALSAAQKALEATPPDVDGALADIKQAQAVTDRTPFDDYLINSYLARAYIQKNDYASADAPMEAAADSPLLPDDQKKPTYSNALPARHERAALSRRRWATYSNCRR